jgi:FixJ family two-component response regulator
MKLTVDHETKESLITIVDDEACIRESLSSLIRSAGYRAKEYSSAEDFLTWGWWDEPACLILDVRLPAMNGLQLQRYLEETPHAPPIVFVSGHASENEQTWAMMKGAVAFLRKPFSDESLLKAVRHSIARTVTLREHEEGPLRTRVCPLCHETTSVAEVPERSLTQENDLRTSTLEMIKILKPEWSEQDGLCERCWRLYVGLGRVVDFLRSPAGLPNDAPGENNPTTGGRPKSV